MCVDNEKTLKFYNFMDKVAQQEERVFEEQIVKFQDSILPFFKNIDVDRSGAIDLQEAEPLLNHFIDLYQKQKMFEQNPNNHELALEFFRDLNKHEMYLTLVRLYFRHNMYQEISDS